MDEEQTILRGTGKRNSKLQEQTMNVNCLAMDYDGTLSPIETARTESHIPSETRLTLRRIARIIPVLILTTKDMRFIKSRAPFAYGWSAIGGLETRIGNCFLKRSPCESEIPGISKALEYVRSTHIGCFEIEEKQNCEGYALAFCIDWRLASDPKAAKKAAEIIAANVKALHLTVFEYKNQPFMDVYPTTPNKGHALQEMLREINVEQGVMYLGDSEIDNPAFKESDIAVGVTNGGSETENLQCDFFVEFTDVPKLLRALIANNLQFKSDFPMLKVRSKRIKKRNECSDEPNKNGFDSKIK